MEEYSFLCVLGKTLHGPAVVLLRAHRHTAGLGDVGRFLCTGMCGNVTGWDQSDLLVTPKECTLLSWVRKTTAEITCRHKFSE